MYQKVLFFDFEMHFFNEEQESHHDMCHTCQPSSQCHGHQQSDTNCSAHGHVFRTIVLNGHFDKGDKKSKLQNKQVLRVYIEFAINRACDVV